MVVEIKTYKKTATIDALQWDCTWSSSAQIVEWAAEWNVEIELVKDGDGWKLRIPTLEGPMFASPDDFIAKGVNNEFWAIKPDIMAKTYQEV
jgi:hypothetical protein